MFRAVKYSWKKCLSAVLYGALLFNALSVQAVEVRGLYRATIEMDSREDAQERRRAFSEAMQRVLAKVSGSTTSTSPASIRRALNNPEPYVESWSTQTRSIPVVADDGTNTERRVIEIQVNFYETEIQRLLDENDIPVWPGNRPETLVWLVVQDELGERRMLGGSNVETDPLPAGVENFAARRGLPLLFPLLDLEDQLRLNVNRLWELDEAAILNASQRYRAESILAIRVHRSLSGELLAKSLYLFRDNVFSYEEFELDELEFLRGSVNLATNELAQYYAVLLSGTEGSVLVDIQIDGIDSPADYATLLAYLNTLEGVNSFQLKRVEQGSLTLQLDTGGQLRQLVETIALEPSMQQASDLSITAERASMHYRWVRD